MCQRFFFSFGELVLLCCVACTTGGLAGPVRYKSVHTKHENQHEALGKKYPPESTHCLYSSNHSPGEQVLLIGYFGDKFLLIGYFTSCDPLMFFHDNIQ